MTRHWIVLLVCWGLLVTACAKLTPQSVYHAATEQAIQATTLPRAPAPTRPLEITKAYEAGMSGVGAYPPPGSSQLYNAGLSQPLAGKPMVIKDANMELLVDNTDLAITQVTQMAADYGGYVISSQTWFDSGNKFATLRLGIPSTDFENALSFLRNMGIQVLEETASGQDVSSEYADLATRLKNLEATADRVRGFLEQATTVEESLKINATLSDLEGQIEQLKGQMNYYEGRSAFSTVTVTLTPQYPTPTSTPAPTSTPGWNPGITIKKAGQVSINMLQTSVDLLIWLLMVGWPIILLVVIIIGIVRISRRGLKKH